jgi:hypothetical protein
VIRLKLPHFEPDCIEERAITSDIKIHGCSVPIPPTKDLPHLRLRALWSNRLHSPSLAALQVTHGKQKNSPRDSMFRYQPGRMMLAAPASGYGFVKPIRKLLQYWPMKIQVADPLDEE